MHAGDPGTPCVTQHVSAWACLIRSDYNFVFIAFAYFIFVSSREHLVTNVVLSFRAQVLGIVGVLVLLDILFFVFVPRTWLTEDANNSIWNSLKSMHGFAIFCSVIVLLLKVPPHHIQLPLLWFLWGYRKETQKLLMGGF